MKHATRELKKKRKREAARRKKQKRYNASTTRTVQSGQDGLVRGHANE